MYAFSVALVGHYSLTVKSRWMELPTLFVALVGKQVINKSWPISIFTQPLENFKKLLSKRFLDEFVTFKKSWNTKNENGDLSAITDEPVRRQLVIPDATPESYILRLENKYWIWS